VSELVLLGSALWLGILTSISPCPLATTGRRCPSSASGRRTPACPLFGAGLTPWVAVTFYTGLALLLVYGLLSARWGRWSCRSTWIMALGPVLSHGHVPRRVAEVSWGGFRRNLDLAASGPAASDTGSSPPSGWAFSSRAPLPVFGGNILRFADPAVASVRHPRCFRRWPTRRYRLPVLGLALAVATWASRRTGRSS
jgi:hypothetical protein